MKNFSKRMTTLLSKVEERTYSPIEAIKLVKENANAKFDETIEAHIRLGIDPKYTDQQLRTTVALPNGTGQNIKIAVVTRGEKVSEATKAGADLAGEEDLVDSINKGEMDFDLLISTPDMMPKVAKLGRVLGPRGLMPNPKSGTVTNEIGKAIVDVKNGKIDFKVDKTGIIHASVGKVSFDPKKIEENANELLNTIKKLKPSSSKGVYFRSISLSSTMSSSIKIDSSALAS